jgi:hypothetical protein
MIRRGALHTGWPVLLIAASTLTGCSWLVDAGADQCSRDRDCGEIGLSGICEQGVCVRGPASGQSNGGISTPGDGGVAGDPGSCLGSMRCNDGDTCFKEQCVPERDVERFVCEERAPPVVPTVHFEMNVREFVSNMAPMGLRVSACEVNDVSCANAVATWEDTAGTGTIVLDLPYEFDGYLEVQSDDVLSALWYFTQPLRQERMNKDLRIPSPSTVELLAAVSGLAVDASKGLVILEAFDCSGMAVPGIHFEESKQRAIPFFIIDDLPNTESTVTVRDDTANQALGGFLNATPGFTIFTARIGVEGTTLGVFNAHVRANTVTYLDIYP